jgi:hypothetical protein
MNLELSIGSNVRMSYTVSGRYKKAGHFQCFSNSPRAYLASERASLMKKIYVVWHYENYSINYI